MGVRRIERMKKLDDEVSTWPHVSIHPRRFGGREFRFRNAEVGHMHTGSFDIPFSRSIRDAPLEEGLVEEHRWVPNSGWMTFHFRSEEDFSHAVWLLRLSYLRYAMKAAPDPRELLDRQSQELDLSPHFRSLLKALLPVKATRVSSELLTT